MICIQPDWLTAMLKIYQVYNRNPTIKARIDGNPFALPMGVLAANQFGNSCHLATKSSPDATIISLDRYTLIMGKYNTGIAGGILMTDYQSWTSIGGYDSTKIYAGDDGYYCHCCYQMNKIATYVEEIGFYHPYELNKQYVNWKKRAISEINQDGPGLLETEKKGFFNAIL